MNVIYEPKGRAREYSEWACNLYKGCTHGCKYCYAPACMRTSCAVWHKEAHPRARVLELFEKDAAQLRGNAGRVLFCFLSDPYQPLERTERLTRQALQLVKKYRLKSQILTKGSAELIQEDMGLIKDVGSQLGLTLCFTDDALRQEWEPHASTVTDRLTVLKNASKEGVFTWVSLEPVIDPDQALDVIRQAHPYVNYWKIGKLNHNKAVESSVDWRKFLIDVEALLKQVGAKYLIKKDLYKFASADSLEKAHSK